MHGRRRTSSTSNRRLPSSDLRDQLQATLSGRYTLERELGGGGMSRVFVAEETALDRKVVIKVLPPETAAQVSLERFKREILLAARLQHPHIVPLLTAGESNGLPYFTMPFVDGESLRVRLARHGELPVNQAIRMLREIASALAYAHEHGIVHRDIKPDNVLLSGGSAMVTDFGVAKALSASSNAEHSGMTSLGVALGTPAYMSPEQASADPTRRPPRGHLFVRRARVRAAHGAAAVRGSHAAEHAGGARDRSARGDHQDGAPRCRPRSRRS